MSTSDSRFKGFRFNSLSKPPPLPPKDSAYPPSISSFDTSPNSPNFSSPPPTTPVSDRPFTKRDKALGFLKFPKRSPRSPTGSASGEGSIIIIGPEDDNPPPPEPDSQISTPWNFQHNIHVDEGYIGLPPSWSMSLASAGFTPEEIADIQARRTAGSLASDLRYLYTERPTSPLVAGFQSTSSTEGPLLSKPNSRSASLPLSESPRPPPMLFPSSSAPRPPPKRKPPLPADDYLQNGHKPNQSSSSTAPHSSDSHQSNQTPSGQAAPFSSANNSTPHRYPSQSTSNLSLHPGNSIADQNGQKPLAKVSNLAPNDAPSHSHAAQTDPTTISMTITNASSEFGVAQAGENEERDDRVGFPKSIWGIKRIPIKRPSLASLASSTKAPSSSVMPLYIQQQQISQSALTSTSLAAAASSSISTLKGAAASTSNSIAAVVRNTKGVIRRGLGTGGDSDNVERVENAEDRVSISDSLDIDASGADDEWSPPAGPDGRRAVWQLYTQPKNLTDGSSSRSLDVNQPTNTTHTTRGGGKSLLPFSKSQGSLRSLTQQNPSIKKANSQVSLNTNASVSQHSLNSVSAATTASGSGTGLVRKHQNSESITSLPSIPEAEGSSHLHTMGSDTAASSSSSSSVVSSLKPSVAPHLTLLHQSKASLDLSLWSEALLSGLAKSGESNSGITTIHEETLEGKKDKGKDIRGGEGVTENGMEKGKNENEFQSPLATARPFGYPTQTTDTNRNVSTTATGTTRKQQPIPTIPTTARYPVPARPIPPFANNTAPSSTSSLVAPPHYHHGYGQSRKPPPAAPLPPPPSLNVPTASNNNMIPASALITGRGILSPPSALVPVTAIPPSALLSQSFKSPTSAISPDSAQIWSEIETMMDPGIMEGMGLTGTGVKLGAGRVTLGHPLGVKESVNTAGGAEGGLVMGQVYAQASRLPVPGLEIDTDTGVSMQTVGDLVGSSPDSPVALAETFSPILPFSPEEERVAATRVLRAGEGVLGTKRRSREWKNVEEGEGGRSDSRYADGRDLEGKGEGSSRGNYKYSNQKEPTIHISKPAGSTNRLLIPDNQPDQTNRDSSHSTSSTLTAEEVVAATTIVRKVSVARRAGAVVLKGAANANPALLSPAPAFPSNNGIRSRNSPPSSSGESRHPPSPLSSHFGNSSEESAGSLSLSPSPSSPSQDNYPTPATDSASLASPLLYYLDGTQTPSPQAEKMVFGALPLTPPTGRKPQSSRTKAQNEGDNDYNYDYSPGGDDDDDGVPFTFPDEITVEAVRASMAVAAAAVSAPRPTIVISDEPHSASPTPATTNISTAPLSPFQQYRGWLSAVVAPLEEFIDEAVDPRDHYLDLKEIAEGESGSVFSACLNPLTASKLRLPPAIKAKDAEEISREQLKFVAIKSVAIVPSGSPKLVDLQRELTLMKGLGHENVLGMDGVYVDLVEDSLWVRMELMERSLADMVGLVGDGLMLQDRMLARFASDVLSALEYLQKHFIAHRDVRSDNLLLNKHGVLKLADFSNAVQVTKDSPIRSDFAGVVFWQAPEVRKPPYDVLKVDVWSLGATVWEMAQTEPPFSDTQQFADRWPPLRQPELYSPAFHHFLQECSEPASSRPSPSDLLKHPFIHNACGRSVIIHLLSQCMAIEQLLQQGIDASP